MDHPLTAQPAKAPASPEGLRLAVDDPYSRGLARWLFSGGLAHPSGAIAAWRDLRTGSLSYEYPEITGYFLTLASALGLTGTESARRAADRLIERHRGGERESRSSEPGVVYTFDTVVQGTGLLNFGRAEGCDTAAKQGASLLMEEAQRVLADGDVQPLARGSKTPSRAPTWSTRGRLHLLKAVQGFCLADEYTGSGIGTEAAHVLVARHAGEVGIRSGHFSDARGRCYLHPFCYALEGLWTWSSATEDGTAAALVRHHLQELVSHQLPAGGMPATLGSTTAQLDVTAQVARLGALLSSESSWLPEMLAFLRAQVRQTEDGTCYVPYRAVEPCHQSSWPSMFTLQALHAVTAPLDWRHLV
jgi:hypothetical protein